MRHGYFVQAQNCDFFVLNYMRLNIGGDALMELMDVDQIVRTFFFTSSCLLKSQETQKKKLMIQTFIDI